VETSPLRTQALVRFNWGCKGKSGLNGVPDGLWHLQCCLAGGPRRHITMKHQQPLRLAYFEAPATDEANRANGHRCRKNSEDMESKSVLQPLYPDKSPSEGLN